MENKIKIFESEEFGKIRTLVRDGEPWFVGKDIAVILGYSNTKRLCPIMLMMRISIREMG